MNAQSNALIVMPRDVDGRFGSIQIFKINSHIGAEPENTITNRLLSLVFFIFAFFFLTDFEVRLRRGNNKLNINKRLNHGSETTEMLIECSARLRFITPNHILSNGMKKYL